MEAEYSTATIGGAAHRVTMGDVGHIKGVAYTIKEGVTTVSGTQRKITFNKGAALPENSEGKTVILKRGGVKEEYIVIHQGKPDSDLYDASCDGIWLLRSRVLEYIDRSKFKTNAYNAEGLQAILTEFYNDFDAVAKNAVKTVKIPYYDGSGVKSGAGGIEQRAFILSAYELTHGEIVCGAGKELPKDGAALSYFEAINDNVAITNSSNRVGYLDAAEASGAGVPWTTRTAETENNTDYCAVTDRGGFDTEYGNTLASVGFRPSVILNSSSLFDPTTYELVE